MSIRTLFDGFLMLLLGTTLIIKQPAPPIVLLSIVLMVGLNIFVVSDILTESA